MRSPFLLFLALILLSCSDRSRPQLEGTSYWAKLKDSFATKNLDSFVLDSQLQGSYKNLHQIKNHVIDSVIRYGTPYLYSWQEGNFGLTAFTTVVDDGEHGRRIIYFILDGKDSLCAAIKVASKGGEGGIIYETRSRFLTKDTLLKIISATTQWDLSKPDPWSHRLSKSKGDSTFFHSIFLKKGQVLERQFAEKKELRL